ncbi:MAG: hypothetical protein CVU18_03430 [Betaproteobacteria bacterium HGW-Betaproteobacteria-12]|jgi:hypothetical protein|nr:MAG: hypothetical protein CVU18_03430 [Betaproteobacteria bacterium HGW-Betaproteobacteria-12]
MRVTNPRPNAESDQYGRCARLSGLDKLAHDICLELKHETCLMLYGEISAEQFRAKRNALVKAFRELRVGL